MRDELSALTAAHEGALAQLEANGQDVSTLRTQLTDVKALSTTIDNGCTFLIGFLDELRPASPVRARRARVRLRVERELRGDV